MAFRIMISVICLGFIAIETWLGSVLVQRAESLGDLAAGLALIVAGLVLGLGGWFAALDRSEH